ncbi:OLC1v1004638C1 [Oldenlandia corymbosa var. corymbosa]|uniref:Germin-like protein n=1 Tax=Oldenlandia corymbosa var. corymbosa TaxID=529605 RepID=A0AAV1DF97_OLDCO|nr:OLC1v1004638C1 [Oldenlandia corymbosa var. corymbosa]
MATFSSQFTISSLLIVSLFANSWMAILAVHAEDAPESLVPKQMISNQTNPNPRNVKGVRGLISSDMVGFCPNQTMNSQLSGSNQGVSLSVRQYNAGEMEPPNINPYSAELLLLLEGNLEVGFVDTQNKLYQNTLQPGDMFLFPSGLVNFKSNPSNVSDAKTVAVLGGITGNVYLPPILLSSGVDDGILAQSFKTDQATIKKLRAGMGSHT